MLLLRANVSLLKFSFQPFAANILTTCDLQQIKYSRNSFRYNNFAHRGPVRWLRPVTCSATRHVHARATEFLQGFDLDLTTSQKTVREAISKVCSKFPDEYWLQTDETKSFPSKFHSALARDGLARNLHACGVWRF